MNEQHDAKEVDHPQKSKKITITSYEYYVIIVGCTMSISLLI